MHSSRSWSLLLLPGGLVVGHGASYALGAAVGGGGRSRGGHGFLEPLLCLSVPLSLGVFARALIAGLRAELVSTRFRQVAPMQAVLFAVIELLEHGDTPGTTRAIWMLVGLVAQVAAAALLCAVVRAATAAGAGLRKRRLCAPARAGLPRRAITAGRTLPQLSVALGSLSRRGPPLATA